MKYTNKQYLINIFIALCFIIMVILISMYLLYKPKNNNDTFQNTADSTNDNYFSVDTINKITSSNLSIPTIEQNTLMIPEFTILPYYGDFDENNVINLINNNYLPCNDNAINQGIINKCNKSIIYSSNTAINMEYDSAFYTISVIYPGQVSKNINIPDLRRLYMAGAGDKIKSGPSGGVHQSFNSDTTYTKGKIIGEELHKLTLNELARHKHVPFIRVDSSESRFYYQSPNDAGTILTEKLYHADPLLGNNGFALISTGGIDEHVNPFGRRNKDDRSINADISKEGKDEPHENRPPTIIVNYIMYVGELPNKSSAASN